MGIVINPYSVQAAVSAFPNVYSCDFDGTNDYVDLESFSIDGDAAWSISFWAYLDGFSSSYPGALILKTDESTGFCCFFSDAANFEGINFGSSSYFTRIKTTGDISASLVGAWKHIVLTYNGSGKTTDSNYIIYVDGSVVASATPNAFATCESRSNIGRANSTNYFDGNIDEVAVWNSELSSSNVTTIYNSGTPTDLTSLSPVKWWRMGDGSTYPNILNTMSYSKKSINFDGVDDYVAAPVPEINGTSLLSISFWCKRATSTSKVVISDWRDNSNGIWFYWTGGVMYWQCCVASSAQVATYSAGTDTDWHHWVGTYSASANTIKLYFDGNLVATRTGAPTALAADMGDSFVIGKLATLQNVGHIDDVAVWTSELSASNVTSIYNSGVPTDISSLNPVTWWKMGDDDTYPTLTDSGSSSNDGTMTNMASGDIEDTSPFAGIMTNMAEADIEESTP